jgi:hypothetical protein
MEDQPVIFFLGIAVLIALIFGLIAMIVFTNPYFQGNICKLSISTSVATGTLKLNCEPARAEIKRTDFNADATAAGLDELVKKEIAGRMWACWDNVDKGRLNPYKSTYEAGSLVSTQRDKITIYLICDIVTFKDIPNFRGMDEWITLNSPSRGKVNYFSYLNGRAPTPDEVSEFEKRTDVYFTSDKYVVAWKHVVKGGTGSPDSIVFERYAELLNTPDMASSLSVVVN